METTCEPNLIQLFNEIKENLDEVRSALLFKPLLVEAYKFSNYTSVDGLGLRQLSTKLEASGKVRVFAMVDS